MTVHLCSTEQTLRSIVSLQGPSDAAAATAMWVGGEEREKMIPEQHHQVYSFLVILKINIVRVSGLTGLIINNGNNMTGL